MSKKLGRFFDPYDGASDRRNSPCALMQLYAIPAEIGISKQITPENKITFLSKCIDNTAALCFRVIKIHTLSITCGFLIDISTCIWYMGQESNLWYNLQWFNM